MKKNNLMTGALVLSVGGVLAKLFSAVYRIILTRILGGVGIGLYQLIFPIYSLCVVLATAGLPMAISKVIAKNKGCERAVIKKCMFYILSISLVLTIVMAFGSNFLAWLQGNNEIAVCYIILAPSLMLVSASSVLRGYFQGVQEFTPSALSNILEQFIKLCFGLLLSVILIQQSLLLAIVGAVVGIVISEIVSLIILILSYKNSIKKSKKCKIKLTFKEISKDILPITLTNLILPLSSFVDSVLVVNLLKINFSGDFAVFLYGLESGAVSSLVNLPTIFSFAIASAIMPSMSLKDNEINKNNKLNMALKVVLIIAVPCIVCFTFFPNRLIESLYGNRLQSFGMEGNLIANKLLILSGFGIVGLVVNQVYSTSLQAVNLRRVTIKNLAIAVLVKFIIEIMFMPFKNLNIYALAIANTVCYLAVMMLNHVQIRKRFKLKIGHNFIGKLMLANFIMIISMLSVFVLNNSVINTIVGFIIGVIIYFVSIVWLKILNKKDLAVIKYKIQ